MRPKVNDEASPRYVKVGMVPLLVGDGADPGGGVHRAGKVIEPVRACQHFNDSVLSIRTLHDAPARSQLRQERRDRGITQRRDAAAAGHAGSLREVAHCDIVFDLVRESKSNL